MSNILLSQVAMDADEVLSSWHLLDPSTRGGILVFSAIGLVTLLVLVWAIFIRKRRRRKRKHHHSHEHSSAPLAASGASDEEEDAPPPRKHHRWRHSRRKHRTRNPTLAETGGLPPIRPEGPPAPLP